MNLQFSGDNALILGGSCDLAISLAGSMIESGLFPTLTFRSENGLSYITEKLKSFDGKYSSAYLDFGDRESLNTMFEQTGGNVDYLVDFVQGDFESLIASADEDDVYRYFAENISFRAEMIKKAARIMLTKKMGRLVYVSSSAVVKPNPGQGFYAAAKLASEALYRNLGLELGGHGVTTVTLRPGYIDEGRGKAFLMTHGPEVIGKVPIKRALCAAEIAEAILFYLSDSAGGFNATEISVDGGLTAGK
ncbi:MAG: SDR family oxidoreductase [Deltaproteobacteria bacterium]|nr:SDR family oxidoreductase [Deltaproteobacteria bacterium]